MALQWRGDRQRGNISVANGRVWIDWFTHWIDHWTFSKNIPARLATHRPNIRLRSTSGRKHRITDNNWRLRLVLHQWPSAVNHRYRRGDLFRIGYGGRSTNTGKDLTLLRPSTNKTIWIAALTRVKNQKLDDKLFDLATRMRTTGHATADDKRELNNIDVTLTQILQ